MIMRFIGFLVVTMTTLAISCGESSNDNTGGGGAVEETSKIDSQATERINLEAASGTDIAGSALGIPPGSLAVDTTITMSEGAGIADNGAAIDLELGDDVDLSQGSRAVLVESSEQVDPAGTLILDIPLDGGTALNASDVFYVVIFKVHNFGQGKTKLGLIRSDQIEVVDGVASFPIKFFGVYQVARINKEIVTDVASVDIDSPILSAADELNLLPFDVAKPTGSFSEETQKVSFSTTVSEGITVKRCGIIIDRDKQVPWDVIVNLGTDLSRSASPVTLSEHTLYGLFVCRDVDGRTKGSGWSQVVTVRLNAPALANFTAATGVATHTVQLSMKLPTDISVYKNITLERSAGSTAKACGSGTKVVEKTTDFTASSTIPLVDKPGGGTFSYRPCVYSLSDTLNDETTAKTVGSMAGYTIFASSLKSSGDLQASIFGQTFSSGLEGADYRCQNLAEEAGLGGTWKAILSDSSTDASSRISADGEIYNVLGESLTDASSGFWSKSSGATDSCAGGTRFFDGGNFLYDENGDGVGTDYIWTGSDESGAVVAGTHCSDWTSTSGNGHGGQLSCPSAQWIDSTSTSCSTTVRLSCISQP